MGFALPSGVVNTDSVYFYADDALALGPLIKQISDQTLIVLDYSQLTPTVILTSYTFSIDVSSNPQLVVAYPQLDASAQVLTFLLSGGIEGQQYNVSVNASTESGPRTDVLTISIPSSGDCACETINPVPWLYTQLPLGSQGYINSATRFFWGSTPPSNPNVLDQWYNPDSDTLYEWITDGVSTYWETIMSEGLVEEAPISNTNYVRYNGYWVVDPIQSDAAADGGLYVRRNNAWYLMPQYVPEAPGGGIRYGRYNGTWQPDAIQTDAPNNANAYVRSGGGWLLLPPGVNEAPLNTQLYSRSNSNWVLTPIQADAPSDGKFYARNNGVWTPVPGSGIQFDAPTDGSLYGRQNATWMAAYPAGNPNNYQSAAQVAQALSLFMPLRGGTFTGAVSVPGLIISNGPTSLQINGGQPGQILAAGNTASTLIWAAAPPTEAPLDGVAYARQDGIWVPTAAGTGLSEAPQDGTAYVRINATWSNIVHTDITDWDATLATLLQPYALITQIPLGSITFPMQAGVNAIGTSLTWARADHVHPIDTSRYAASNPAGYQTAAQVTAALAPYALASSVPTASNLTPVVNGTATAGLSPLWARGDHCHPTDTTRLAIAGGTMTGTLTLVGNPANPLDAVPKQYVDNSITTVNIDCGTF
jgi:hypothetical protein